MQHMLHVANHPSGLGKIVLTFALRTPRLPRTVDNSFGATYVAVSELRPGTGVRLGVRTGVLIFYHRRFYATTERRRRCTLEWKVPRLSLLANTFVFRPLLVARQLFVSAN